MTTDRADRQAIAQVIQAQWKKLNVGVNLQFLYGRGLFATDGPLTKETFQAADYTWSTGDDPQFMGLYNCAGGQNYPKWCNKDADAALLANEVNPDTAISRTSRQASLAKFYGLWTAEVPVIPLFLNSNVFVARVGLKGFRPGTTQYATELWNVWEFSLTK